MTRNPILKVLSIFQKCGVKNLLIGGQACIIYGAAEFSRDSDFVILCEKENLFRLKKALKLLKAKNIYLPPLKKEYLERGHACHFRCFAKGIEGLRIDVMVKMRGCDEFLKLWERKFVLKLRNDLVVNVISVEDLVQSKKTQRDKDWLMIKKLIENDILLTARPNVNKIKWWLCECRTAQTLIDLSRKYRKFAVECVKTRPLLKSVLKNNLNNLEKLILKEELIERKKDKHYWQPLLKELESLRHARFGHA
ncbi:MAG: hypothetical protein HY746_00760 [Elusimicrobia bacterium]|nr:hypothetical protein [Elusimicrobiota bacterium]